MPDPNIYYRTGNLTEYSGAAVLFTTVLFAVQLYADFAGYSYTALGAATVLGFDLKQNFRQPYLSLSVSEFWRRWHMSLNVWLRDYIYIPLGGNRCSKARKNFNTLATFAVSGIWHGADWGYLIWGASQRPLRDRGGLPERPFRQGQRKERESAGPW